MGVVLQCYTTLACSFGSFLMGLLYSWPSYTIDELRSPNTTVLKGPMTELEISLLGSVPSLGAMVGTAVTGLIIDKLGRQKGGVILALPFVISWLLIGNTKSSLVMLVGRFVGGISGGAFLVFTPLFISEIAQDSIRGMLASGSILLFCFGSLVSYLCGWWLTYRLIIWTNLVLSVLGALMCYFVVESPLFLLKQNREEEARQAIAKYRGESPASKVVLQELSRLKVEIGPALELVTIRDEKDADEAEKEQLQTENEELNPDNNTEEENKMSTIKLLFTSPTAKRAFWIVATTLTLQIFMGMVPVLVYAKDLFAKAVPNLSGHVCSVLLAIILTSGSLVTSVFSDKAGRRILLITSATMVALCMTFLGILLQTNILPAVVSAVVILVYCFFFNFGAGSVPYVLIAEVFTPEVQGLASMILLQWVWILNFVAIAIFPLAIDLLGIHGVFYCFAVVAIINAIYSYFMVPETKGLSKEQIQELLLRRKRHFIGN